MSAGGLGAAMRALGLVVEGSQAAKAARDAWLAGGSIRQAVEAFAAETEGEFDDELVADLVEFLEQAASTTREASVLLVRAAVRVDAAAPRVLDALDETAAGARRFAPRLRDFLRVAAQHGFRVTETLDQILRSDRDA